MELEGIRKTVFLDRYSLKDEEGNPTEKHPREMWKRVASGIAQVEEEAKRDEWCRKFEQALTDFRFVPGGRILAGAGTGQKVTFYNCYVIPSPEDSRRGIMDSVAQMVEIMSRGGGVGINLSTLRPRGSYVKGVNGTASGPVSWAEVFSTATGSVIQGGSRRGALMLMLNDDHPDVEEFIRVKEDLTKINNANLSVCISDRFMKAVKEDLDWDLTWNGKVYRTISARQLWDQICESAWRSGEPGVVFMERYQNWSNTWYCEEINCVNPCGEQGLGPWGVCNLGAINLSAFVRDGELDMDALRENVSVAVRFLDDVIDSTEYFFPENEKAQRYGIRRIGLGTMGLADALIKLKIRYGSQEAIDFCERVYSLIRDEAYRTSALLAEEKGPFPLFDREKYLQGYFIKQLPKEIRKLIEKHGIRNGVLLTQAPTGTTSIVAGVSSGIEPVYAFSFKRTDRTGTHIVYHQLYEEWIKKHPDEPVPEYFVSADQLTPEEHVRMQAVIQKYVDSSISKTVNAPNEHTVEQVKTLYTLAYDLGCKGVTYFRDGCRDGVLSKLDDDKDKGSKADESTSQKGNEKLNGVPAIVGHWGTIRPIERPKRLQGFTDARETPLGKMFLTLNTMNGHPIELFAQIGRAGSDVSAFTEAVARLISLALRCGVSPEEVAYQLVGIGGSRSVGFGPNRVLSVPDAIGQFMLEYLRYAEEKIGQTGGDAVFPRSLGDQVSLADMHAQSDEAAARELIGSMAKTLAAGEDHGVPNNGKAAHFNLCPSCGMYTFAHIEGCSTCFSCGYSEC